MYSDIPVFNALINSPGLTFNWQTGDPSNDPEIVKKS